MSAAVRSSAELFKPRAGVLAMPPPKSESPAGTGLPEQTEQTTQDGEFITPALVSQIPVTPGDQSKKSDTSPPAYGATKAEWQCFARLALDDLLPVVSDPNATISTQSKMTALGKTPSQFNRNGHAVGIPGWTSHHTTQDDIEKWSKDSRLGICVQTRRIRAIDCDLENAVLARNVHDEINKFLGINLPTRSRSTSPKFLLAFNMPGDYPKRVIHCDGGGMIEFLGSGNQFVACGTHPSKVKYEWKGGLPDSIPTLTPNQFEALWKRLEECFAAEGTTSSTEAKPAKAAVLAGAVTNDRIARALIDKGANVERDGKLLLTCPFADGHTPGGDDTVAFFPKYTGGFVQANFKCLHASCSHRTNGDFFEALGIASPTLDDFDVLDEAPAPEGDKPRGKIIGIGDLLGKTFTPLNWVVPKVLPEGLFLLVSAPKIGKSWLSLQLVLAVATGGEVLGQKVKAGDALYLALEDNERRLQDRLRLLGADTTVRVGRADFATEWALSNAGGTEGIDAWLTAHPNARLVVVDVLERFRPRRSAKGNMYAEDYAAIAALKKLSDKHRVAILVVHHTRKGASDDPFATVSGSQALTGGADGTLILERDRGESRGKLHLTGRDIKDDGEFVVEFEDCRWKMLGTANAVAPTYARQEILDALHAGMEPMTPTEVAEATGRKRAATQHLLKKMVHDGVASTECGKYWPTFRQDLGDHAGTGNDDDLA